MKTRETKELLQLMLDNQDLFTDGLCRTVLRLYLKEIITNSEIQILNTLIENNKPVDFDEELDAYYWEIGDIKPRLEWIKKQMAII